MELKNDNGGCSKATYPTVTKKYFYTLKRIHFPVIDQPLHSFFLPTRYFGTWVAISFFIDVEVWINLATVLENSHIPAAFFLPTRYDKDGFAIGA